MYKKILFFLFSMLLAVGHLNGAAASLPEINTTSTPLSWGDHTFRQDIEEFVSDGVVSMTTITLNDGKDEIGTIMGKKISPTDGIMSALQVNKKYRKKGLGSYLFKTIMSRLATIGCTKVTWTAIPTDENIKDYDKAGEELFDWYKKLGAYEVRYFIMGYVIPPALAKSADENKN